MMQWLDKARKATAAWLLPKPEFADSVQVSVSCSGTFAPTAWGGSVLPTISAASRVYKSFKPTKCILTETVKTTWSADGLPDIVLALCVDDAADLLMTTAFFGADNAFPNAPHPDSGIHGPALSNHAYSNGMSWPRIEGGTDVTLAFAVEQTALTRVQSRRCEACGFGRDFIPAAYGPHPKQVEVKARCTFMGPCEGK